MVTNACKRFLFLQGPHGPFFQQLGRMLRAADAEVWRVGFNAGDRAFWHDKGSYIAFTDSPGDWPAAFADLVCQLGITDIVLYGDTRPVHAEAIKYATQNGLTVHVFEEGYLRPYWITYERGGSNGHSRLMTTPVERMRKALKSNDPSPVEAPTHWGDMRQHVFYGALYHWFVMFRNGQYRHFRPHRNINVRREFRLYLRRLLMMPYLRLQRSYSTWRIKNGGYPFHLVLLQLEHDASFRYHSPFSTMPEFLELVIGAFAKGAPPHHHLVFKAHPLESGQIPLRRKIKSIAREHGTELRTHYVSGGKLAQLLDHARSAVTINSTAGQQVLWRGLPLKVFGDVVYAKPAFVSAQPLVDFFKRPQAPNTQEYRDYRQYLLETSQVAGGFYSVHGRQRLLRQVVDMMLAPADPYEMLERGKAAAGQQLRIVKR